MACLCESKHSPYATETGTARPASLRHAPCKQRKKETFTLALHLVRGLDPPATEKRLKTSCPYIPVLECPVAYKGNVRPHIFPNYATLHTNEMYGPCLGRCKMLMYGRCLGRCKLVKGRRPRFCGQVGLQIPTRPQHRRIRPSLADTTRYVGRGMRAAVSHRPANP